MSAKGGVSKRPFDSIAAARASPAQCIAFYNAVRRHQSLDQRARSVYQETASRLAARPEEALTALTSSWGLLLSAPLSLAIGVCTKVTAKLIRPAVSAFWQGLFKPSGISVTLSLCLAAGVLASLILLVTPKFMAKKGGALFAEHEYDYDLYSTVKALQLTTAPNDTPKLIILGGSTIRAALLESDIADHLRDSGLASFDIVKLCTQQQSLSQAYTLIDSMPNDIPGVVVLGVTPGMFTSTKSRWISSIQNPRLGIRSKNLIRFYNDQTDFHFRENYSIYALDNSRFLLGRWHIALSNWFGGASPTSEDSRYRSGEKMREEVFLRHSAKVRESLTNYDTTQTDNFLLLREIVGLVDNRKNLSLILFEAPINPRFIDEYNMRELYDRYLAKMAAFTQEQDVPFIRSDQLVELHPSQFYDWAHLSDRKTIAATSAALVLLLRGELQFARS